MSDTQTQVQMKESGFYVETSADTRKKAEADADNIQRCGDGRSVQVRKSASGWDVWVETDEAFAARAAD